MFDLTTLLGWKADAQAAYHQLQIGKSVVEVWRDGRRLNYTKADVVTLRTYLTELDGWILAAGGDSTLVAPQRKIMRPVF